MKKLVLLIFGIVFIFLLALASASIVVSPPEAVYNLGDMIKLETKITMAKPFSGFLRIVLFCDGRENLMYFSPIQLEKKEKTISINFPVKFTGNCYVIARLEDENKNEIDESETAMFVLTDKINIQCDLNRESFKPGEFLEIVGTAVKANGQNFDGNAIITIKELNREYNVNVSNGKLSFSTQLSSDIAPGIYTITIKAKDEHNNSGISNKSFIVLSIPKTLKIETNNETFLPDTIVMIVPKLLDQANNTLNARVLVKLSRAPGRFSLQKKETLLEEFVDSGNFTIYRFTRFNRPGNYMIEAFTQEPSFYAKKDIIVERYEKINVSLNNAILYVTNIGNVDFENNLELELLIENQSIKRVIPLNLKVNGSKSFKLEAPKGNYTIRLKAGSDAFEFKNIPLSGYVTATINLGKKFDFKNIIAPIILLAIVLTIVLLLQYRKSRKLTKKVEMKEMAKEIGGEEKENEIKKFFSKHSSSLAADSISYGIVYGTKQEITPLFVHLDLGALNEVKKKDPAKYAEVLDEYFKEIVNAIKEHQGVADLYGNDLVVLFNIIKQYRHDIAALRTAEKIREITRQLNKKLAPLQIKIGMKAGINIGMANVTSLQNRMVKYTAIGDTVALAKALQARALDDQILISEKIYERVANIIKAKKVQPYYLSETEAINVYALESTMKTELREKGEWFVKRALGKA